MEASRTIWIPIALAAVVLAACGPRVEVVRMDPMEFSAERTAGGVRVDLLDPQVLFVEGSTAFEERRYEDAVRKFGLILKHFGETRFAKSALYNRGLALLAAPRPGDAATDFDVFVTRFPADPDAADAWQRLGQAASEAGDWERAEKALRKRLTLQPLSLLQEVELRARLARALRLQARYEEAREEAQKVLALHDRYATLPEMDGAYYVAMACFELAEAYHDLFGRIKFVLPVERMEKDLVDKATLFLRSQSEYLRTMRLRNTFWGVAAGVRVGRLYEEFYEDIMTAEVPPDLTPEELAIYQEELRKRARPLVSKAVDAYERNLALAKMYGAQDEWFGDMAARLERLRRILQEIPPPDGN
jgi:tetratricopeptide (TPR) repeat protein